MNKEQAYSWLIQPGIQATLFHYDKDTNEALRIAIQALAEKEHKNEKVPGSY